MTTRSLLRPAIARRKSPLEGIRAQRQARTVYADPGLVGVVTSEDLQRLRVRPPAGAIRLIHPPETLLRDPDQGIDGHGIARELLGECDKRRGVILRVWRELVNLRLLRLGRRLEHGRLIDLQGVVVLLDQRPVSVGRARRGGDRLVLAHRLRLRLRLRGRARFGRLIRRVDQEARGSADPAPERDKGPRDSRDPLPLRPGHGLDHSFRQDEGNRLAHPGRRGTARERPGQPGGRVDQRFGNAVRPQHQPRQRRTQPPALQTGSQQLVAAGQSAPERPVRAAQAAGRLVLGQTLQVAEHHRDPAVLWKLGDLIEDDRGLFGPMRVALGSRRRPAGLMSPPAYEVGPKPSRRPVGGAVKPASQPLGPLDAPGLAGENEKGRLKRVVRVIRIAEQPPAHPVDHRPVPGDQRREGRLGAIAVAFEVREPLQQRPVLQPRHRPGAEQGPPRMQHGSAAKLPHRPDSPKDAPHSSYTASRGPEPDRFFSGAYPMPATDHHSPQDNSTINAL